MCLKKVFLVRNQVCYHLFFSKGSYGLDALSLHYFNTKDLSFRLKACYTMYFILRRMYFRSLQLLMFFMIAYQLSHILDNRWLPLGISIGSFLVFSIILLWFKFGLGAYAILFMLVPYGFFLWFRDVSREGSYQGHHSSLVISGLKWGLVWFLFSEVWFFFSIFWSFFHMRVSPLTSISLTWPFIGINSIPPFQVPMLNTLILLISGVSYYISYSTSLQFTVYNILIISLLTFVHKLIIKEANMLSSYTFVPLIKDL